MSAKDLYDFEGIVETAGKAVLTDLGLTAATTQDAPAFQKKRPRVELQGQLGAGLSRFVVLLDGVAATPAAIAAAGLSPKELFTRRRESAWLFTLKLLLLTDATIATHTEYRAEVRSLLGRFWTELNGLALQRHAIELRRDAGTSGILHAPEEGIYRTDLSFEGVISVQADAWAALEDE